MSRTESALTTRGVELIRAGHSLRATAELLGLDKSGKPAVFDTIARVFYTCATHTRAREWARELNEGK